jgi:rhodanese-related sulfurtransferase
MKRITMLELKRPYDSLKKEELILDVRTPAEFANGHVRGAKNIPVDRVMNHVDELRQYNALYVHCAAGMRSQAACEILSKFGLQNVVCIDEGGYADWAEAGFPVER